MLTYESCKNILSKRDTKKLANNTYLRKEENCFVVKLHNTDIIKIYLGNIYELNTNGWQAATTKARLNEFTPARIYQKRGIWYLGKEDIPFFDSIVVNSQGEPVLQIDEDGEEVNPGLEAVEKRKYLDKQVSKYIDGYVKWAVKNGVGASNGDCWFCLFGMPGSLDHVWNHVKDRYYFGSFLKTAIQGCGRTLLWLELINIDLKKGKTDSLRQVLASYFKKVKPRMLEFVVIEEDIAEEVTM